MDREIGVDIESRDRSLKLMDFGLTVLCDEEYQQISRLPLSEQNTALLNCWTRKEAILKALGTGLSLAPDRLHVTCRPGEQATLLSIDAEPQSAARWSMLDVHVSPQFIAALAIEGPIGVLQGWDWERIFVAS